MTPETAKQLRDYLLPQLQQEFATTRKVLAAVPADRCAYKPSDKCMSGLELAAHIALAEAFFLRGVLNGAFDWKQLELKTPAEVLAYYDETVPPLMAQLASLSGEKLAQDIAFAKWNQPESIIAASCRRTCGPWAPRSLPSMAPAPMNLCRQPPPIKSACRVAG